MGYYISQRPKSPQNFGVSAESLSKFFRTFKTFFPLKDTNTLTFVTMLWSPSIIKG